MILLISHEESHRGYVVGLKPTGGGSIPSFLVLGFDVSRLFKSMVRRRAAVESLQVGCC